MFDKYDEDKSFNVFCRIPCKLESVTYVAIRIVLSTLHPQHKGTCSLYQAHQHIAAEPL